MKFPPSEGPSPRRSAPHQKTPSSSFISHDTWDPLVDAELPGRLEIKKCHYYSPLVPLFPVLLCFRHRWRVGGRRVLATYQRDMEATSAAFLNHSDAGRRLSLSPDRLQCKRPMLLLQRGCRETLLALISSGSHSTFSIGEEGGEILRGQRSGVLEPRKWGLGPPAPTALSAPLLAHHFCTGHRFKHFKELWYFLRAADFILAIQHKEGHARDGVIFPPFPLV